MTAEEIIARGEYLEHFNPFHNPKNGQFAKKSGGGSSDSKSSIHKKAVAVGVAGAAVAGTTLALKTRMSLADASKFVELVGKTELNRLRAKKAFHIGKRSVEGFLAAYGGVRLGSDIINRKKGGE